jgi:hypothetical protein
LRVPAAEREQAVDGVAGREAVLRQQAVDVGGGLLDRELGQLERSRLAVERALLVGEQRAHQ